jgi:hypothetical protein
MLLTRRQVKTYLPGIKLYRPFAESNRVEAHHVAIEGNITNQLEYRLFTSYSLHYGNYRGLNFGQKWGSKDPANNITDYAFYPALKQWNFMLETKYRVNAFPNFEFLTTLALDRGELTNNFGVMIGGSWTFLGE